VVTAARGGLDAGAGTLGFVVAATGDGGIRSRPHTEATSERRAASKLEELKARGDRPIEKCAARAVEKRFRRGTSDDLLLY
jgi:hypothetical protein